MEVLQTVLVSDSGHHSRSCSCCHEGQGQSEALHPETLFGSNFRTKSCLLLLWTCVGHECPHCLHMVDRGPLTLSSQPLCTKGNLEVTNKALSFIKVGMNHRLSSTFRTLESCWILDQVFLCKHTCNNTGTSVDRKGSVKVSVRWSVPPGQSGCPGTRGNQQEDAGSDAAGV